VIATQLSQRGVCIALHYLSNRAAAESTQRGLAGTDHALFDADLADPIAVAGLWRRVVERFSGADIVINNAGIYTEHTPLNTSYEDWVSVWNRTLAANLQGPAHLSLLAAQSMAARIERGGPAFGRGRIVNISSRGAFRGEPDAPAYGASKAGLNALSQCLAKSLAPRGIYVYCVAPGWVETEMAKDHLGGPGGAVILEQHPLGRVNQAGEVAAAAVYCALDAPAAMTGGIIDVNGASYLRT